ncbi:MAG: hypothetical protein BA863_04465 [Desulfovibrio sp. S3730MH75]|nr:MAG: hypothetical protein BA863_04465 [Desulfovibrio sp. S3730MH75]
MPKKRTRKDIRLESEGAEFLVLGRLLLEKITAFKTYTNFPGYDLIVTNAENNISVRIQVKSRYQTNWDGFIIKNFDCEFVVFFALNRGYSKPRKNGDTGIKEPEFYILPISYIMQVRDPNNEWDKIVKNRLVDLGKYQNQWSLIQDFLG